MAVFPWVIKQLGGDLKTLTLAGFDAPHGRPRQKPIVKDGVKIRQKTVRYPGNSEVTRHIFGDMEDDWELSGRFSDRRSGSGYAAEKVEFIKAFVRDAQKVAILWGNLIAVTAFITEFEPAREASGEVAWRIIVQVDRDDLAPQRNESTVDPVSAFSAEKLTTTLAPFIRSGLDDVAPVLQKPITIKGSVFDLLDTLVSGVGSLTAAVADIADQLQSIEKASIGEIRRFRGVLGQLRTSLIETRENFQFFTADLALQNDRASDDIDFWKQKNDAMVSIIDALGQIADADHAAAIAERGSIKAFYVARQNDTWESISMSQYQSADRAGDIREMNAIEPGEAPTAGTTYLLPT